MNALGCSHLPAYFHSSSSRSAKYGTTVFLVGILLLFSLLILGSSAFAQATLTPATLSFGSQAVDIPSVVKTATFKNTQTVPLTN